MLPDKRPRLIFFLYFITIAQYNSKIYRKIGYTCLKQSAYKFSSLYLLHLPAILNITKRAFRPRFGACSQKYSGLDQNCMRPVMRQFSSFLYCTLHRKHTISLSRDRVNKGTERKKIVYLCLLVSSLSLRDFTGKTAAYKSCATL